MIFQKDKLAIRRLKETDKVLLVKWLSNPSVLEYYEGRDKPHDLEMVNKHFYSAPDETVTACIVECDESPVGYIQFYPLEDNEKEEYGYTGLAETIYGTDQFIGEIDYWNRGIGTLLVRSMVAFLVNEKGADRVVMDPQAWNGRALACYEKCGFRKVKFLPEHELHEGNMQDCWLLEYKP